MAELRIGRHVVLFDDCNSDLVASFKWTVRKGSNTYYAHCLKTHVSMHRLIMCPPKRHPVDHINFNGLDNRRKNLRICHTQQNVWHSRGWDKAKRKYKCPYKGVWPVPRNTGNHGGKLWEAKIGIDGRQKYIGMFHTAEQAARAYDDYARYFHGSFAVLNFPQQEASHV